MSGIEHGRWENFDEHGCRCGACVKAWQEHGREIEQVVASDKVDPHGDGVWQTAPNYDEADHFFDEDGYDVWGYHRNGRYNRTYDRKPCDASPYIIVRAIG